MKKARVHLELVASLYQEQIDQGRYFLHEHPRYATSWSQPCITKLVNHPTVQLVTTDQCQYGSEVSYGTRQGMPVKKPSGFMSNAQQS